jgi:uncharacterized protein (TIGR03382 family)
LLREFKGLYDANAKSESFGTKYALRCLTITFPFPRSFAMKNYLSALLVAVSFASVSVAPANAALIDVFAQANSSSGGVGASSGLTLSLGQSFSVVVSPTDLWSAGALPRWSNANGLIGPLLSTGSDESGTAAGTAIGANFGTHTQSGLSAPFGALVGEISGTFFLLGTSFSGPAPAAGLLNFYYWDSNSGDNSDKVSVNVQATGVPAPGTLMLFAAAALPLLRRRR